MKKIPGTLYQIEITETKEIYKFNLNVWQRDQIIYEKTKITQEEIVEHVQNLFENKNYSIPRNRIEWVVQEEIKNANPESEKTFLESTVTGMLDEFQESSSNNVKKIILIGLSNAGKTCIYERIFEGKKPWELMHSSATKGIAYKNYEIGKMTKPMIWDLGGQQEYLDKYHENLREKIFQKASILLFIADVTDSDRFEAAREEFSWAVEQITKYNPKAIIHLFFHKIDAVNDKDVMIQYLYDFFTKNIDYQVIYHTTSIFDESLFRAWSDIIQELSPKSTYINNILKQLKNQKDIKDALVIDKNSGLACGSTLTSSDEDVVIGMTSLIIITLDRVASEMRLKNVRELRIKSDNASILFFDVTSEFMLVIITKDEPDEDDLNKILSTISEVSKQIKNVLN